MALRIETETLPFKEPDGSDSGATYTIRRRLSHRTLTAYVEACATVRLNPEAEPGQEAAIVGQEVSFDRMADILLEGGLVGLQGVEDSDGTSLPLERFRDFDNFYVAQVVRELQKRALSGEIPDPNSPAPSDRSSAGRARNASPAPSTLEPVIS